MLLYNKASLYVLQKMLCFCVLLICFVFVFNTQKKCFSFVHRYRPDPRPLVLPCIMASPAVAFKLGYRVFPNGVKRWTGQAWWGQIKTMFSTDAMPYKITHTHTHTPLMRIHFCDPWCVSMLRKSVFGLKNSNWLVVTACSLCRGRVKTLLGPVTTRINLCKIVAQALAHLRGYCTS